MSFEEWGGAREEDAKFCDGDRTFYPFINDKSVRLVGVEAAGEGSSFLPPFLSLSSPPFPTPSLQNAPT